MNDETKEILIDLIEYYNKIGTNDDPGIKVFENIAQRSSKALERHVSNTRKNSADVNPYAINVEAPIKHEEEL